MNDHVIQLSDKAYWHRYLPFYEPFFSRLEDAEHVLEYGVAHGASIRYLSDRFPRAHIVGCDILAPLPEWPRSERISYVVLDQGDPGALDRLHRDHPGPFDLVIEDGSHEPAHQRNCLVATLPRVRDGGVYVLEDLHTSHPDYVATPVGGVNSYHLLLAFEHLIATAQDLGEPALADLARTSLFTEQEVATLWRAIATVDFYRRSSLPLRCYRCGSDQFAYDQLRCRCGTELVRGVDSISAVVTTRGPDRTVPAGPEPPGASSSGPAPEG